MNAYFAELLSTVAESLNSVDDEKFSQLVDDSVGVLANGGKVIVSGLGKNVPVCEKFVGTMFSFGKSAAFLHTNTAVHGDIGIVTEKDLVIVLTKSGETAESVYLTELLKQRGAILWLLSFKKNSTLAAQIPNSIILSLKHEGDMWDIVPNNSTTVTLMILQALAIQIAQNTKVTLPEFKRNHPGGHIGVQLKNV